MIDRTKIGGYADAIMAMIAGDTPSPVPAGVTSFAQLHDYVDANMYLVDAGVPIGTDPGAGDDGCEMANAVADEVSMRMAGYLCEHQPYHGAGYRCLLNRGHAENYHTDLVILWNDAGQLVNLDGSVIS